MSEPRMITAESLTLEFRDVFGPLGPARGVTGHFTGGSRAGDWRQACDVARRLHVEHLHRGWGGCGYHYLIADDGTLVCLRPAALQGAHVGGHNAGNVGVVCAGAVGHRPTRAQRETYAWLLENAHTRVMPEEHRTTEPLAEAVLLVHGMWHGHSANPCPGWFEEMYLAGTEQPPMGLGRDPDVEHRVTGAGYAPATEVRGIVADGVHVSVLEAHRAAAALERDAQAGAESDLGARRRPRRMALAVPRTT